MNQEAPVAERSHDWFRQAEHDLAKAKLEAILAWCQGYLSGH
jgi:hypothetical protein